MLRYLRVVCALASVTSLPPVTSLPAATSLPLVTSPSPVTSQSPETSPALPIITNELTVQPDEQPSPVANESSLLEEEIKHSLRKDNDDYLLEPQPIVAPPPADLPARRFHDQPLMVSPINLGEVPARSYPPLDLDMQYRDARKLVQRNKGKHAPQSRTISFDQQQREEHGNKLKELDKKHRLFVYTSSTKIAPSQAPATLRSHSPPTTKRIQATFPKTTAQLPSKPIVRVEYLPHKPWGTKAPEDRRPPNADQLDMAPARGAYIHDLRLKGRFCHRHVLWPEGPKYDSKGNVIMPAFNADKYNKGRNFADTTKPMFVLPRCCNCCKKSVLGCQ